jgi:hypothetical protein
MDDRWNEWVIDATLYKDDGILCFVPIENRGKENESVVFGMNILSDIKCFDEGKIVGFVHMDGQDAVDKFCNEHPELLDELTKKRKHTD